MKYLALFACLPLLAGPALACPIVQRAVVNTPVVVAPAVVASFVPVTVPAYSASYQPTGSDPATLALIREHHERLLALESQGVNVQANATAIAPIRSMPRAELDPAAVRFVANCSKCHDATVHKGDLTLFRNGAPVDLTCEQALACINAMATDRMPKGGRLEKDSDGPAIVAWLSKSAVKQVKGSAP